MYKIQPASTNDITQLSQFAAKTYSDTFQHYNVEDLEKHLEKTCSESYFRSQINNSENKTIIIKENNIIIAYAKYGKLELPINNPILPSVELHRLYVDTTKTNTGIGTKVINYILEKTIKEKHQSIYLGVYSDNKIAIKFYQKHGFQKIGEYNYPVGLHIDLEYIMQKKL
tara:strand:- start:241 stop:750 length:510 start_codon:yes stop_codon:yes gene_type:complete